MKLERLGNIVNFKRGYDLPSYGRIDGPYPIISSSGISGYHNEYKASGEGVIIGRYGTLGKPYYINGNYWPHNTALYATDFFNNSPKYVYYLLSYLGEFQTGSKSAVPGVNRNDLHEVMVPYIQKHDQEKITKVLSDLDSKIELNNKINAELEAMAKLIYDYWFVQFDFPISKEQAQAMGKPELEGKPYRASGGKMVYNEELKREIPVGWEVKNLGEYAKVKKGTLITEKTADNNGSIKVVSAGLTHSYFHSESNYPENTITVSASGANAGYINFWREPIFACDCTTVRGKNDAETLCILGFLRLRQSYIMQQARGSAQPHVYPKDLEALKFVIPPDNIITNFGKIVIPGNKKVSNNLKENQELASLRDWLLPMLMNGQVTIKEAEEQVSMAAEGELGYGK